MTDIKKNLEIINKKIYEAVKKSGRQEGSVRLEAVSKFHPVDAVLQALQAGQFLFGENRVQEAYSKFPAVFEQVGALKSGFGKHAVNRLAQPAFGKRNVKHSFLSPRSAFQACPERPRNPPRDPSAPFCASGCHTVRRKGQPPGSR